MATWIVLCIAILVFAIAGSEFIKRMYGRRAGGVGVPMVLTLVAAATLLSLAILHTEINRHERILPNAGSQAVRGD